MNSLTVTIKLDSDTESRILNFEGMCALIEGLMATTLANRLASVAPGDKYSAEEHIKSWFKSVRQMAVAQWLAAGVTVEVKET